MNELIFFITMLVDLAVVLIAWRLGKHWVVATIVANVILVTTFAAKLIPIFGLVTNAANVYYAAIFIATDILTEHEGKRAGYRSVWMGFLALALFVVLGQLTLQFTSIESSSAVADAMHTLFAAVPRIAIASFTAYAIAQSFDIWFFHWIRERTGDRMLWLRNNASTATSQLMDSVIFFSLAFAGTVPFTTLLQIIFTGYIVKLIVGVIDTPFIYASYWVIGKSPPDLSKSIVEHRT